MGIETSILLNFLETQRGRKYVRPPPLHPGMERSGYIHV